MELAHPFSVFPSLEMVLRGPVSRAGTYLFRSSISATISGSGTSLFHGTISGDGSLKYLVLSTELVPTFSMVPSLGMVP